MATYSQQAVVLLPIAASGLAAADGSRRWLARGRRLPSAAPGATDLARVLQVLGLAAPADGLAALRFWGQTGERPRGWIAGADPVWLEARLDRLYLHAPPAGDVDPELLGAMFRDLDSGLPGDGTFRLRAVGDCGYLCGDEATATAAVPAQAISGREPGPYLPGGAPARRYHELSGEIQMVLHDHPGNERRAAAGQPPLNALWLWGGGTLPAPAAAALPPLFGDPPLLRGYWHATGSPCHAWPESIEELMGRAPAGFVAAPPGAAADALLTGLRRLLRRGRIRRLTLLFADGVAIERRRADRLRFWRRPLDFQREAGA